MSDPHAGLKEDYWDVKYREWRIYIVAALFILPTLSAMLVYFLVSRPPSLDTPTIRQREPIPAPIQGPSTPPTTPPIESKTRHIQTYQKAPCDGQTIEYNLNPDDVFYLPTDCASSFYSNRTMLLSIVDGGSSSVGLLKDQTSLLFPRKTAWFLILPRGATEAATIRVKIHNP